VALCVIATPLLSCVFVFAQSQYEMLWNFAGSPSDGAFPLANRIFDRMGNLYGTTKGGGSGTGSAGTVFKLSPHNDGTWIATTLYSFCSNRCLDGAFPQAGLVFDSAGNLHGTTYHGGSSALCGDTSGCGVVFELTPPSSSGSTWTESVLYNFCTNYINRQCLDGFFPNSQLVFDASGNLYGTTTGGGSGHSTGGTVFEVSHGSSGWTEAVLYNFCSLGTGNFCPDGAFPQAGVTFDKTGNLYGTTDLGGSINSEGGGTVYKLSFGSSGWTETILLASKSSGNGSNPMATVSFDTLGSLYTTFSMFGGPGGNGAGGVVRLGAHGGNSGFSFGGVNGSKPVAGVLIRHNTLYGTTESGGSSFGGTVFKISPPAQEAVLYNFCSQLNCTDGNGPTAGLVADTAGNLYGTAPSGGAYGQGVVFEIVGAFPKQSTSKRPAALRTILP
jgi:uncharacterized repeat protein (TIGR03803 family)